MRIISSLILLLSLLPFHLSAQEVVDTTLPKWSLPVSCCRKTIEQKAKSSLLDYKTDFHLNNKSFHSSSFKPNHQEYVDLPSVWSAFDWLKFRNRLTYNDEHKIVCISYPMPAFLPNSGVMSISSNKLAYDYNAEGDVIRIRYYEAEFGIAESSKMTFYQEISYSSDKRQVTSRFYTANHQFLRREVQMFDDEGILKEIFVYDEKDKLQWRYTYSLNVTNNHYMYCQYDKKGKLLYVHEVDGGDSFVDESGIWWHTW